MMTKEAMEWIGKSVDVLDKTHELYSKTGTIDQIILDGFDWKARVIFPSDPTSIFEACQIGLSSPDKQTRISLLLQQHADDTNTIGRLVIENEQLKKTVDSYKIAENRMDLRS